MTENSKKIDKLLRLAKEVDESTFQRKSQYQSFKSKKGITPPEIQRFIDGIESTYVFYLVFISSFLRSGSKTSKYLTIYIGSKYFGM